MSKEEYLSTIEVLDEKIKAIMKEKLLLRETYINANMEFPIGSKVKIEYADDSRPTEFGIVVKYDVSNISGVVRPCFVKIKKNGCASKTNLYVDFWRHPTITLVVESK